MKIITIEEHFSSAKISAKIKKSLPYTPGKIQGEKSPIQTMINHYLPTNDDIEDVGDRRLSFMDKSGIDMQVLSYGSGSPQGIPDAPTAISLCKEANDELAELITRNPSRFAGFATLPVADPIAAAAELERTVVELGFKGVMLGGTFQGRFFDEDEFFPIFSKAASLNVPIYMHPGIVDTKITDYYYKNENWPSLVNSIFAASGYGWHMDSGLHVIRLILSGIFDKLPGLQIISGHWGEFVPFFLSRLERELSPLATHLEHSILHYYKNNVFVTPSGIFDEPQLKFAIEVIGAERIIYSGDYPYIIDTNTGSFLINSSITPSDKEKISHLNVERLLGL